MDLRKKQVTELSDRDLETLAGGLPGYPPGRAGDAKAELLRRNREYVEQREKRGLWWTKFAAVAALVSAIASVIAASVPLFK